MTTAFYSHADKNQKKELIYQKFLKDHLREVGQAVREAFADDTLKQAGYLAGISHDFGKYTSFFQDYLLNGRKDGTKHHHGFISALLSAYLIEKQISRKEDCKYYPLLAYSSVLHHHGDLQNFDDDVVNDNLEELEEDELPANLKTLQIQLEDLAKNKELIEKEYQDLEVTLSLRDFIENWQEVIYNLQSLRYSFNKERSQQLKEKLFSNFLMLYSALIDSDKRDAAQVNTAPRKSLPESLVENYRQANFNLTDRGINGLRTQIYDEVLSHVDKISLTDKLFTITAPTGLGKTLMAFGVALRLISRLKKEKGYEPRIIYALPFTSIIDQNYRIFNEVMRHTLKEKFDNSEETYLIKHHHLADLKYTKDNENEPLDKALLQIESWNSEVVVTTFVQFLHTVIGFKNKFLKKYHNIAGSIILLDEVQNIPVEYWLLVDKVLGMLARYLNCYILLLTATKPLIFQTEEVTELVPDPERYFQALDRITITPKLNEITLDELYAELEELYDENKSFLIILNTINSSLEFYQKLKREDSPFASKDIYYLSSNIIPKCRQGRIQAITEALKDGKKPVVVSTQVVEAGVDLDFDVVIRDFCPFDSLMQAGGRCNRNSNSQEKGSVYLYRLKQENGKCYSSFIYGKIHSYITKKLLENKDLITEKEFPKLIDNYFKEAKERVSEEDSKDLIEAITTLNFHNDTAKSISNFQLIEDQPNLIDIFVEADENAVEVWEKYQRTVVQNRNFKEKRNNYLKIKKELNSYVISVPNKYICDLIAEKSAFPRLPIEAVEDNYDVETGFRRIQDDRALIF